MLDSAVVAVAHSQLGCSSSVATRMRFKLGSNSDPDVISGLVAHLFSATLLARS